MIGINNFYPIDFIPSEYIYMPVCIGYINNDGEYINRVIEMN